MIDGFGERGKPDYEAVLAGRLNFAWAGSRQLFPGNSELSLGEELSLSAFMKIQLGLIFVLLFGLVGCIQFEKNMESDEFASDINSLNKDQEEQVSDFAAAGQLNSYEEKEMNESISGSDM